MSKHEGQIALITGGASGIGAALGRALAAEGATVLLADRQVREAQALAEQIRRGGGTAEAHELDVRDAESFETLVAELWINHGHIDLFFNNAGIGVGGDALDYKQADWDDVNDVNVRGVMYGIQAIYPRMVERGSGHIVNTASVAGLLSSPGMSSYTASKHAVVGLSKALRVEASFHGVRVSALCPGAIRTPIISGGRYGRMNIPGATAARAQAMFEKVRPMDPDAFAKQVLKGVRRDDAYIIVPRWWKALWLMERLSPRLGMWLGRQGYLTQKKTVETWSEPAAPEDAATEASARLAN